MGCYLIGSPIKVNFAHDYFTSALPNAQSGNPVTIPLFENERIDVTSKAFTENTNPNIVRASADDTAQSTALKGESGTGILETSTGTNVYIDPNVINGNLLVLSSTSLMIIVYLHVFVILRLFYISLFFFFFVCCIS